VCAKIDFALLLSRELAFARPDVASHNGAMSDVTRILSQIESGDPSAAEQLLPLVYNELRKLAAARLARENVGQTLQATALVHEAYLRLVGGAEKSEVRDQKPDASNSTTDLRRPTSDFWHSRGHFFAAAAEAMRRILVESARRKQRLKHGGQHARIDLDSACAITDSPSLDLLALDEALSKLAAADPAKADLVKLRYFAGFTMPEAASALGISLATAERHWAFAKSWLHAELAGGDASQS